MDHGSANRVVRDEKAGVDRRRVVLLDAARYERGEQEVPICGGGAPPPPPSSGQNRFCGRAVNGSDIRTGDHIRQLVTPPKRNDDLAPPIVARDEPVRVREHIRELTRGRSEIPHLASRNH